MIMIDNDDDVDGLMSFSSQSSSRKREPSIIPSDRTVASDSRPS